MPEKDNEKGDEKLLILPLGEESKKITQVISNDTARQIIEMLADAPLSASDIAQRLNAPISTVIYNLENLESVGLIKIERIKYSEKGREVKIYAPVRKLIVVVPEKIGKSSVADLLKKYLGVILAAVFASSFLEFFTKSRVTKSVSDSMVSLNETQEAPELFQKTAPVLNETMEAAANYSMTKGTVEAIQPAPIQPYVSPLDVIISHPGLVFLLGCLFIILVLLIMDYRKILKRRNS